MSFLLQPPQGFSNACETLNRFPQEIFLDASLEVVKFLEYKVGMISAWTYKEKLAAEGVIESEELVQGAINAVVFILRGAMMNKTAPEELLTSLKVSTILAPGSVAVLKHVWSEHSLRLLEVASKKVFSVGQLVKFDWKLAMAVESSKCKNIETPYISVVAHVSDSTGKIVPHAFDMSFSEFNNFAKQMKTVAGMLETL